jgi:hypothetical protein
MKNIKLSRRELVMIIAVASIAFLWAYFTYLIGPLKSHLAEIEQNIDQTEKVYIRYQTLINDQEKLLTAYENMNSSEKGSEPYSSVVEMVEDLQNISEGLLQFKSILPLDINTGAENNPRFEVEIDCTVSFDNILKFLYVLEHEKEFLSVKRMNLLTSSGNNDMINARIYVDNGGRW